MYFKLLWLGLQIGLRLVAEKTYVCAFYVFLLWKSAVYAVNIPLLYILFVSPNTLICMANCIYCTNTYMIRLERLYWRFTWTKYDIKNCNSLPLKDSRTLWEKNKTKFRELQICSHATCLVAKQRNFVESKGQFLKSSKTMLSYTGPVIKCQTHMRPSSKQTPSSWQLTLVLALIEIGRRERGEKRKRGGD